MPSFMIVHFQTSEIKRRIMRPDFSDNKEEIRPRDFWAAVSVAQDNMIIKILPYLLLQVIRVLH